jgi:hypothetical protein
MYPVITVREINFMRNEILKIPAITNIMLVQIRTLGMTESAKRFSDLSSKIIPNEAKIPKRRTAVAFVGPKVMNFPCPQIPPIKAAMPEPISP